MKVPVLSEGREFLKKENQITNSRANNLYICLTRCNILIYVQINAYFELLTQQNGKA